MSSEIKDRIRECIAALLEVPDDRRESVLKEVQFRLEGAASEIGRELAIMAKKGREAAR